MKLIAGGHCKNAALAYASYRILLYPFILVLFTCLGIGTNLSYFEIICRYTIEISLILLKYHP